MREHKGNQQGLSLIETVVYIGLLGITLPALIMFSVGLVQKFNLIDPRIRVEQKAGFVFSQLSHQLTSAQSIDTTNSTLRDDDSVLVFTDDSSTQITIDRPEVAVNFPHTTQLVHRLRMQSAGSDPVWLTDKDISVNAWRIDPVYNTEGDLTGLNAHLEMNMINAQTGVFRGASFAGETTFSLHGQTIEE